MNDGTEVYETAKRFTASSLHALSILLLTNNPTLRHCAARSIDLIIKHSANDKLNK